jgi:DNA-binding phage protein
LRTYGELVQRTLQTVDRKRLNADGSEPSIVMRGVTIPRPVHVKSRTRIGKEIIVDPTDTDEDYTAEMLSATDVLEYRDPEKRLDALRTAVRAAGIKRIARMSGVARSKLQAFVNQGVTPHISTIAKIEAILRSAG